MARKSKKYYLFSLENILLKEFNDINSLSEFIYTKKSVARSAAYRGSVLKSEYYVSNDILFDIEKLNKKCQHNPWLRRNKA
jgi:hypothetical protein